MWTWVKINSNPVMTFYSVEAVRTAGKITGLAYCRLLSVGQIARPCSVGGGAENANLSISLDNSDGFLMDFFRNPPHRARALVEGYYNEKLFELFRGVVSRVVLASEIQIDLEF